MTDLFGHDPAWREFRAAITSPRMHHAWMLTGLKGLGKGLFARAAAAELVREPDLPQPPIEAHPDILIPEHPPENKEEAKKREDGGEYRRKRSIPIDEIRALTNRLHTRPTLGSRRVVIIDPADDLERNAANALLKALEEPPVGTFFLLVTHRPGRLLPTIRSRCRVLRFAPLENAAIDRILCDIAPQADAAARAAAVAAAEGSPGAALEFVEQDLGKLHQLMVRLIAEGDEHFALRGALAEEIGARPDRERQQAAVDLARAVVAAELGKGDGARNQQVIAAHGELVRLSAQMPTYNFDPALAVMEIGALLASLAMPREAA
ncbi:MULTISPECIES: AAA family ATPase [unclassified Novosphingobium]|uniref:AAA family ATPase n=1 Tax=unclassified Novosphingobium TaxID=2644732 RepID=UPI0025D22E9B|nr:MULTISPECIES: AAA family ATPase [unclassified Novosphingobium]HQV02715.1 AAA family ATPase [Novosphingobium sp.]